MNNTSETVNTTAQMINQEGLGTVILALFIVVFLAMQYMQWKQAKADREANEIANTNLINTFIAQHEKILNTIINNKEMNNYQLHEEKDLMTLFGNIHKRLIEDCREALEILNADRTAVYVFHNGSSSIHDLPFFKFSCIAEFIARGSGSTSKMKAHNSVPIDLLNQIIDTLTRDGNFVHFKIDNNDNLSMDEKIFLNKLLLQETEKTCILYSIYDMENRCMGFIFAEFGEDNFTKEELKEKKVHLKYLAEKLSPILEFSNYYKKKTGKLDITQ